MRDILNSDLNHGEDLLDDLRWRGKPEIRLIYYSDNFGRGDGSYLRRGGFSLSMANWDIWLLDLSRLLWVGLLVRSSTILCRDSRTEA